MLKVIIIKVVISVKILLIRFEQHTARPASRNFIKKKKIECKKILKL